MSGGAKRAVLVAGQAKPIAPYTPAVLVGNTLYVSGQIALLADGKTMPESVGEQTRVVLDKVKALVEAAGMTMDDVVDTTVLLADMSGYGDMNGVYATYFGEIPPARAAFAVKGLPLNALVEIKAVAVKSKM